MEYTVTKKNSVTAEAYFKVKKEELNKYIDEAYVNFAKKVKIPGFRVGKAPLEIVKRNFDQSNVIEEAIKLLISKSYSSVFDHLNPKPISLPYFEVEKFDDSSLIEFKATYEYYPDIKLPKYKKVKILKEELIEDYSFIDSILNEIAKNNYEVLPKESKEGTEIFVEENDIVLINLKIYQKNKELYNLESIHYDLEKDKIFANFKENLLNKKINDEVEFESKLEKNIKELKKAYNKKITVKVKVLDIKQKVAPPINDELARLLNFENLESLKEHIKNSLKQKALEFLDYQAYDKFLKDYIKNAEIEVPEIFIQEAFQNIFKDTLRRFSLPETISLEQLAELLKQTKEELEKTIREMAIFQVKEYMIIKEIAKEENLKVTDEEIEAEILKGFPDLQKKDLEIILKQKNIRDDYEYIILKNKCKELILKEAEIESKDKISLKELYQKRIISL